MSKPDHWRRHISTLRRLRAALAVTPAPAGAAEVHLVAMNALWRFRDRSRQRRPLLLRLHQGFVAADDAFLTDFVAAWAVRDMAGFNRMGRDFSLTGGFKKIAEQLSAQAPEPDTAARGRIHPVSSGRSGTTGLELPWWGQRTDAPQQRQPAASTRGINP